MKPKQSIQGICATFIAAAQEERHSFDLKHKRFERISSWRRRVLLKRGAELHLGMGTTAQSHSLAVLDDAGYVIAWYACGDGTDHTSADMVGRHFSYLYVSNEVASDRPAQDLLAAVVGRSATRRAWRRTPTGACWSPILIGALKLSDRRLQGFYYIARSPRHSRIIVAAATL